MIAVLLLMLYLLMTRIFTIKKVNLIKLNFLSLPQLVESSGLLGKGQKRKTGQQNKTITIGSSPILYTQPAVSAGKISVLSICSYRIYLSCL